MGFYLNKILVKINMELLIPLLMIISTLLSSKALELSKLPEIKDFIKQIKGMSLKDKKGDGYNIKKAGIDDFSVKSIQLVKISKSEYKIEFTGVNIKAMAELAVKKKIMMMPKINAEGTAKIAVSDGSINQAVEIKKIGSKWKMNPKHCSSLIGDIKLKLDGKGIYGSIFSSFEKMVQKQAKGYLNKQICPTIKTHFDKILKNLDVKKLLSLSHEEL